MKSMLRTMMPWLATTILLLLGQAHGQDPQVEPYKKLSYAEMRAELVTLAGQFPDVMLLEDSESKLGVPYLVDCDNAGNKCVLDIVTITDFQTSSEQKVQVYISGSLNG